MSRQNDDEAKAALFAYYRIRLELTGQGQKNYAPSDLRRWTGMTRQASDRRRRFDRLARVQRRTTDMARAFGIDDSQSDAWLTDWLT